MQRKYRQAKLMASVSQHTSHSLGPRGAYQSQIRSLPEVQPWQRHLAGAMVFVAGATLSVTVALGLSGIVQLFLSNTALV